MDDLFKALAGLQNTPVPNLLVIFGVIFLFLAFVGEIGAMVKLPRERQKLAGVIGIVLLLFGIGLYMLPPNPGGQTSTPTAVVNITSSPSLTAVQAAATLTKTRPSPTIIPPSTPIPSENEVATALLEKAKKWPLVIQEPFRTNEGLWDEEPYQDSLKKVEWQIIDDKFRWNIERLDLDPMVINIPILDPVTDFYLTVEIQRVRAAEASPYGVLFRATGNSTYYDFRLNDDHQGFRFRLRKNGKWQNLVGYIRTPKVRPGAANRLTVIAQGSTFWFYINGEYVHTFDDDQLAKGNVGLMIVLDETDDKAIFEFDNFELRVPEL